VSFAKSYCLSKFSSHTRLGKEKERKIKSKRLFFFEVRYTRCLLQRVTAFPSSAAIPG
jgi:hypothetical protein